MSPSLLMKEPDDWTTMELKQFHGIIPAKRKTAKTLTSSLKIVANTMAITDIIKSGLISVQR